MSLVTIGTLAPAVAPTTSVHSKAHVAGEVQLGERTTVWPSAVVLGLYGAVVVGSDADIQEGAVVQGSATTPTIVGNRCVVGVLAHLEGCRMGAGCVIGSGAVVLPGAILGDYAVVDTAAVVRPGTRIPAGAFATGSPARVTQNVWQPA